MKTYIDLQKLLFTKNLIKLSKNIPSEPVSPVKSLKRKSEDFLTPIAKKIYNVTSPRSKSFVLEELQRDTTKIECIEKNSIDPDFQYKMENNGLGFFMENIVSFYGKCPGCNQNRLCKYASSNVPVVDLVCTNTDFHLKNNSCFLYQLKISLGNDYFSLKKQTISVGSKKYGEIVHGINGNSDRKMIVPGYICIQLQKTSLQEYNICHKKSFVLVPDYNNMTEDLYYKYTGTKNRYGSDIITWNAAMVNVHELHSVFDLQNIGYEHFNEDLIDNHYKNLLD